MHERHGGHHAPCLHCQLAEARLALRRLASTETFTVPIDFRPGGATRDVITDELHARMRYAEEVVQALDRARAA